MAQSFEDGPIFIRSVDNPALAFTVMTNPPVASSPVTLQTVSADDWNSPLSQWVLIKIADGMYQISLYASSGAMYLQSSSEDRGSQLEIAPPGTSPTQFWRLAADSSEQFFTHEAAVGLEVGFAGDIPVNGSPLSMVPAHDHHDLGDRFTINPVW